jgi:hypothetical protein
MKAPKLGMRVAGSAEFRLLTECCRAGHSGRSGADIPATIDWQHFLRLARFHRVEGFAWNHLSNQRGAPPSVEQALADSAARIAATSLQAAAESRLLLDRFAAAKVPLLFLKGLTLGALAYGNPALKAAIDIDLLVDPGDLRKASELLHNAGYRLVTPRESSADRILQSWHRSWKESVWIKSPPRLQIDLHTRVADNRRLLPSIDVHSPRQIVDIGSGIQLPTLADEELFAYAAVHGASSAWFRLKWISDFAGLLEGEAPERIDHLYRRSQELGAGRAAGQALLLADELFGTLNQNSPLQNELERDFATRQLYSAALKLVTGEPNEPTEQYLGTLTIHWTQFLLLPGARYKMSELLRQANRPLVRARS